jgi:hypothetical protein
MQRDLCDPLGGFFQARLNEFVVASANHTAFPGTPNIVLYMVDGNLDLAAGASVKAPQWPPNMKARQRSWRVILQRGR